MQDNTLLKGKYLSREDYLSIQQEIQDKVAGLKSKAGKPLQIRSKKVGHSFLSTKKTGKSSLTKPQWNKIWRVQNQGKKVWVDGDYDSSEMYLPLSYWGDPGNIPKEEEGRSISTPTKDGFDEKGFPVPLSQFDDKVINELYPEKYKDKPKDLWEADQPNIQFLPQSKTREYERLVAQEEAKPEGERMENYKDAIKDNILSNYEEGLGRAAPTQKEINSIILQAIRRKLKGKSASDKALLNEYSRSLEDSKRGKIADRLSSREATSSRLSEGAAELSREKERRIDSRSDSDKQLLELLDRSENAQLLKLIRKLFTEVTTSKAKVELLSLFLSKKSTADKLLESTSVENYPMLGRDITDFTVDRPEDRRIIQQIIDKLNEEVKVREETKPDLHTTRRTKTALAAQDGADNLVKRSKRQRGGKIKLGSKNYWNLLLSENEWNRLINLIPISKGGEMFDEWFTNLHEIGDYWLEVVNFKLGKGDNNLSETFLKLSGEEQRKVAIKIARVGNKPQYPHPTRILSVVYDRYKSNEKNANPENFAIFMNILITGMESKRVGRESTGENPRKMASDLIKFNNNTLPKLINTVKQGITVNLETGEVSHSFEGRYKRLTGHYDNPDELMTIIFNIAQGKGISTKYKGTAAEELKEYEKEIQDKLLEKVGGKSIFNYLINTHIEVYGKGVLVPLLRRVESKEGDVSVEKLLKADIGAILESTNKREKKRIKALLLQADPTEYFGQDFLKLGELIDTLKKLGVVKGDSKMNKKVLRYDDKNLKVVKLASRLRKDYESLYHDLREIVYPGKGGKLR